MGLSEECRLKDIEVLKFAAACSLTQAPADVGRSHALLKSLIKSRAFKRLADSRPTVSASMKNFIQNYLLTSELDNPSLQTFRKFLEVVEPMIDKAFGAFNIQSAYAKSGMMPFNVRKIMTGCPAWVNLSTEQAQRILDCVPELRDIAILHGRVTDDEIRSTMERHEVDMGMFPPRELCSLTSLEERHPSHQRVLWLNNETFLAKQRKAQDAKVLAETKLALEREEKKRKKEVGLIDNKINCKSS